MKINIILTSLLFLFVACSQVKMINKKMKDTFSSSASEKAPEIAQDKAAKGVDQSQAQEESELTANDEQTDLSDAQNSLASEQEKLNKKEMKKKAIADYCKKTDESFKKFRWGKSGCENYHWNFVRTSVKGDPLVWKTYGTKAPEGETTETTLIMCGVHGDEITPIKFCYDVLEYLEEVTKGKLKDPHTGKIASLDGKRVIVAPLVNPDSYFKKRPTRTNARGVDVNRNFPTKDFKKSAMKSWVNRYGKDKRRYPGVKAMSEPETVFQVNLIYRYQPNKIISVHAPLTMLDYDGPASEHMGGFVGSRANQLLIRMSEQAKGYRIKNYPFFTGSLGNYAGNERNIPTFTLELPSSNPAKSQAYWLLFKDSIHSAVMHEIKGEGFVALDREDTTYKDTRSN